MPRSPRRAARLAAAALIAALAATLVAAPPAAGQAPPDHPDSADGGIQPDLQATLAAGERTDFWVRFEDRADLTAASEVPGWAARGAAVAAALRATADASQAPVRSALDAAGQRYRPFFATNALYVYDGTPALADALAGRAGVAGLYAPTAYALPEPEPADDPPAPAQQQLAWGVENVRAHEVWDEYGVRGQEVTVATIDTGVQYDHPALVAQYRGNLGNGEFDHNYNWFDASGFCADDAPCDRNGHGTHVTGTMVGDDGTNQVGVAPRARWIAANGCCPSDETLIASGQWMLEPTDLNGQNPDAGKRPHIINNSWGTLVPSFDPFMEDVMTAWAASGIFGVWANGNNGPDCQTSGSPGSRTLNYSVGSYTIENQIARTSSRGPGQDGGVKPNIAAPGVRVFSSLPGGRFGSRSGTSMAAPHVAGTVALLWSAVPEMVGDRQATVELLDLSAVDTPDDQCGGTPEHNNVYGQGRLDAMALFDIAPVGDDIGVVTGVVTDDAGEPLADARLTVTGPVERRRTTGPDGAYQVLLPPGEYTVTAELFGYRTITTRVTIRPGEPVEEDFPLVALEFATVTGTVADGSGHGWPLAARVRVDGAPGAGTETDPADGSYTLELPVEGDYDLTVTADYHGYRPVTTTVTGSAQDQRVDVTVPVNADTCVAPGYRFGADGAFANFNDELRPPEWTVLDNAGTGEVWWFDNPTDLNNITGGDGGFAVVDGFFHRPGEQDTELRTPVMDLTGVDEPVVEFRHAFSAFIVSDMEGRVDLSLDGGDSWENLLHLVDETFSQRLETIPIPQASGETDVQVRFRFTNTSFGFRWQLDDILVGSVITCDPVPAGLVVGDVRDANTGDPVAGASVTLDGGAEFATGDDGGYWHLAEPGEHELAAAAHRYTGAAAEAAVADSTVTEVNLALPAGRLAVDAEEVAADVRMDRSDTRTVEITNTGTAPATLRVDARGPALPGRDPDAPPAPRTEPGPVSDRSAVHSGNWPAPGPDQGPDRLPAAIDGAWDELSPLPYQVQDNLADDWDGRVYSVTGIGPTSWLDVTLRYDPDADRWDELAPIGTPRERPGGAIIDGRFYVVGGWDTDGRTPIPSLEIYDIATDTWSAGAPVPVAYAATGNVVLDGKLYLVGGCQANCGSTDVWVYDPAADAWSQAAPYPEATSWPHCGAIGGVIYCAGGSQGSAAGYAYHPDEDAWHPFTPMPEPRWGGAYAVVGGELVVSGGVARSAVVADGHAYDPATDQWRPIADARFPRRRAGSACGFYRVGGDAWVFETMADAERLPGGGCDGDTPPAWLAADLPSGEPETTLAPGETVTVTMTLTAEVDQPGGYDGRLTVVSDTPYPIAPVPVTLTATAGPDWGQVTGTVRGASCHGDPAPLTGALVELAGRTTTGTVTTDPAGGFGRWFALADNRVGVTISHPGYQPYQTRVTVRPLGRTVPLDVVLTPRSCD